MFVSIIIPVYNVELYLKDCLDSVLNQSFADWEAICVNDGSTDGSLDILNEYAAHESRLKIITQHNQGLSAARNAGMREAKGDYFLFLDSDDWLELDALETVSRNLDGEDMLCFSGRRYFEDSKSFNTPDELSEKVYASGMDYYNENALQSRDFPFECVVLRAYNRRFLMDNGLWFKDGIYHEDDLFTPVVCYCAQSVRQIQTCLYNYRVRSNSITTICTVRIHDYLEIANALAAFFVPKQDFNKTIVYRSITHHYQVVFVNVAKEERKELKRLCSWNLYRKVSQTKLRHWWNYWRNRLQYVF